MFPFSLFTCGADACDPAPPSASPLSLSPFLAIFILATTLAHTRLLPLLASLSPLEADDAVLPTHAPPALRAAHADHAKRSPRQRAAALTFSVTVGLAALLGVLIVCEVAEVLDPRARAAALGVAVPGLAVCLVLAVPWLVTMSAVVGAGRSFARDRYGRIPRLTWALQLLLFTLWLLLFYSIGPSSQTATAADAENGIMRAALDRIGIAGISLMALLSGFASVSAPWQSFGSPPSRAPVSEADIARKQAGLDAANEMLLTKRHRLQILERKAETEGREPPVGLVGKLGSLWGASGDEAEVRALRLEVSGLETMQASLSAGLGTLLSRRAEKARAATLTGRMLAVPRMCFSVYCVYRVLATLLTTLRRVLLTSVPGSPPPDPVTRFLSLLTAHYDPTLDEAALARQISFLLSGVILLLSLSSLNQTVRLLSRAAPSLLRLARANLPLLLSHTLATYVFSSALLLRSNLPSGVRGAVGDALRTALEPGFVEAWFQGWFLVGCAATGVGIFVGGRIEGDELVEEMGEKRS